MKKYAALAALVALATAGAARAEPDTAVWSLEKGREAVSLTYSTPESDDIRMTFSCTPKSGKIDLWVSETDSKLKAGKKATAVVAVGDATARVEGKLETNEDAGAPSFSGEMRADDPVFAALATAREITTTVGRSKDTTPLKGAADKAREFVQKCARP